jgi:hypothetical protein
MRLFLLSPPAGPRKSRGINRLVFISVNLMRRSGGKRMLTVSPLISTRTNTVYETKGVTSEFQISKSVRSSWGSQKITLSVVWSKGSKGAKLTWMPD